VSSRTWEVVVVYWMDVFLTRERRVLLKRLKTAMLRDSHSVPEVSQEQQPTVFQRCLKNLGPDGGSK
jgi:hypothetical protein